MYKTYIMSEINENIEEIEGIEIKRKRGRPRKIINPEENKPEETEVKRPRGRPRKIIVEPLEKPPRKKKQIYKFYGNEDNYHKTYYREKQIRPCNCMHCDKTFINEFSLTHHLRYNKGCKIMRLEKALEMVKTISDD